LHDCSAGSRCDNRHLALGRAAHLYSGVPLARIEGQLAFATLLRLPILALGSARRGLKSLPMSFDAARTREMSIQ
jgi:hypothetical protein